MGASLAKVWSKGFLGGYGTPQAKPELIPLLGWSREDLTEAFQSYCMQSSISVNAGIFGKILRLEAGSPEEEAAFNVLRPKKDRVDMLSVFGAMTACSNQRLISRVSFFFSIFDLDGSGSVNRAEFFIATRALMHGIACFFDHAVMPTKRELEDMASDVFEDIDVDGSGCICLGELLNYAYRSGGLKTFLEPFPAQDKRLLEAPVSFARDSSEDFKDTCIDRLSEIEAKLEVVPGSTRSAKPLGRKRCSIANGRQLTQSTSGKSAVTKSGRPKTFSRAHTWFMYQVFVRMAGGGLPTVIPCESVKKMLDNHEIVEGFIKEVAVAAGKIFSPGQAAGAKASDADDLAKLIAHLHKIFRDRSAIIKLDGLGEGCVTLRAFFCVILISLSAGEIETCLKWCHGFRAHDVLAEYLQKGNVNSLHNEDVNLILQALDQDGNGVLTADELQVCGGLSQEQAEHLLERLDKDGDGELSIDEVQGMLLTVDASLRSSFQEAFEGHL